MLLIQPVTHKQQKSTMFVQLCKFMQLAVLRTARFASVFKGSKISPRKLIPEEVFALGLNLGGFASGLGPDVLGYQEKPKMTNMIMVDNFYSYNFPRKLIRGKVLAFCLHLGVFGAGLGLGGPGCL